MRRITKTVAFILISVSVFLSGCSSEASQKYVVSENNKVEIEFSWWGTEDRNKYTMDGLDIFIEENPDIKVKYRYGEFRGFDRKNRVWMKSGNVADVMQINYDWIDTYSPSGYGYYDLYNLDEYIDFDNYDKADLKFGEKEGKLNGLPIALNTTVCINNKDLYDKYGLDVPKTWDDLFEVAKNIKDDGIYVFGTSKKQFFLIMVAYYEQLTGQKAFSEDGEILIDKKGYGIMLDFYKKLIDSGAMMSLSDFDRSKLGDGQCLSGIIWLSDADSYGGILEDNGYHYSVSSIPTNEEAKASGIYIKPATLYAINNKTENAGEAARLLNFLVSDERMILLQGTEKGVPINKKAIKILEENGMLNTPCYDAFLLMQKDKDNMSVMIPKMENEVLIDDFREIASKYVYDNVPVNVVINELNNNLK